MSRDLSEVIEILWEMSDNEEVDKAIAAMREVKDLAREEDH